MTIQTINIGVSPNDNTGDDPRTAGQKLNSNFTTTTHAASRDVGTSTGNIPDADALGVVGQTNWHSGNVQINTILGNGVWRMMINNSGGLISDGSIVAGSAISIGYVGPGGALLGGNSPVGSWQCVHGASLGSGFGGNFLRVS